MFVFTCVHLCHTVRHGSYYVRKSPRYVDAPLGRQRNGATSMVQGVSALMWSKSPLFRLVAMPLDSLLAFGIGIDAYARYLGTKKTAKHISLNTRTSFVQRQAKFSISLQAFYTTPSPTRSPKAASAFAQRCTSTRTSPLAALL